MYFALLKVEFWRATATFLNHDSCSIASRSDLLKLPIAISPQLSVELDETIMSKVAKDNEKTRGKNGKTEKRGEEPDNDQYTAFKITTRGYCLRFCIKDVTCIKKRKSRLKSFLANFVGNLDTRVELRQYQSLSQSNFFLFLTESCSFFPLWTLFFLFFFTEDFLPLLIFSRAKVFP